MHIKRREEMKNDPADLKKQGDILKTRGDLDGAMVLYKDAERICREKGDRSGQGITLLAQADILETRGDLDGALALNKEAERIIRELGNKRYLDFVLTFQAAILETRGDLVGALGVYKEQESIYRELGDSAGLAGSLMYQAVILCVEKNQWGDGLSLADEAYRVAVDHGDVSLVNKIEEIRSTIDLSKGK
jgi:ATP/maltotriose-dependent transcriptional regulator MalT